MKETNQDTNNGQTHPFSPSFNKNRGRLAALPLAERQAIARKGGLIRSERKRLSSQLNPIKTGRATSMFYISKCDECLTKSDCEAYRAGCVCRIELDIRRNAVQQFKAFAGSNPKDMLIEIMRLYKKLEQVSKDNPTSYHLSQQLWLLMKIYKLKFGQKG